MSNSAVLALADGSVFEGTSIGIAGQSVGEVVFNTSMTGYQEILTDPSYAKQLITFTYPHIGNTGINSEDYESDQVWASGLVIRDLAKTISNWRSTLTLEEFLQLQQVVGIADIDTRRLTRILRDTGAQNGCILADDDPDPEKAIQLAKEFPGLVGMDLAKEVSTSFSYEWLEGSWSWPDGFKQFTKDDAEFHVVVYDFGVKRNILRLLADRGCRLTVVPANTSAKDVLELKPDGVFLSNGPGDPQACTYAIKAIESLMKTNIPLFGICLGFQLLALASGAKTMKMKFGHHGANHPILMQDDSRVIISSQNHGFAVDAQSLPPELTATAKSLFDGSLQALQHNAKPILGYQGHPEASPGPHDLQSVFSQFIQMIREQRGVEHHATSL